MIKELATAELQQVTGGVIRMGRAFERGMVDGLKSMAKRPNQSDGHLINNLRGFLNEAMSGKARSWLHGESISSLTKAMRENPSSLPNYSWSR